MVGEKTRLKLATATQTAHGCCYHSYHSMQPEAYGK